MDKNTTKIYEKKIIKTVEALKKNNMDARYFQSLEELKDALIEMIPKGATTALGGSMSIKELGLDSLIMSYDFKDRKKPSNTKEEAREVLKDATFVDYYFMSSNAITEDGKLYNVDGIGNRVAALMWGPDNVVIISGRNKIVKDEKEAVERNKNIAAPANCARLDIDNPCVKVGECVACRKDSTICIFHTITGFQRNKNRIKVFFLNEDLGY